MLRTLRSLAGLAVLAPLAQGCGDELPKRATLLEPVYGDPCQYVDCSGRGLCRAGQDGAPVCLCDVGYGEAQCQECEAGYHRDHFERCAPDKRCADLTDNPCGPSGSCDDGEGVVSCHCDPGYEGPRCTLCAPGYARDEHGDCLLKVIGGAACSDASCSGHGSCDDESGVVRCTCEPGYEGPYCSACAPGHVRDQAGSCLPETGCEDLTCSGHGTCASGNGDGVCVCDLGYAGSTCEACAPGFHRAGDTCVADLTCGEESCPQQATCEDVTGQVVCTCKQGYAGLACDQCALGFKRDEAQGLCVPEDCSDHPGPPAGRVDFDDLPGFPSFDNNCVAGVAVDNQAVAFESIGGDGTVWACAANTIYAIASDHIFLEAGQEGPAEIAFSGPVGQLSFRFGARSELNLEVSADGQVIDTLQASRRATDTLNYVFASPITLFTLRSINGATNQVALDEVSYAPAECE